MLLSLRLKCFVVGVVVLPWLWGCHAPPVVMRPGATYGATVPWGRRDALWREIGPQCELRPGSRVAILECSVEFVTQKHVTPGDRQPMVGGPLGAASALVDLSGVFRRRVSYPRDVLLDFPRDVLEAAVFILEENGMRVVDPDAVANARGYRHLVRSSGEHSLPAYQLNPKGSDVGRVSEFLVYPAWPLRVLHTRSDSLIETAERAVHLELALDATVKIRLRVGMYRGRATIEQGSQILVSTAESTRRLLAERSVVSGLPVGRYDDYELVAGHEYTVDWPSFRAALGAMLPVYLSAGLPVRDGATGAWDSPDRPERVRAASLR